MLAGDDGFDAGDDRTLPGSGVPRFLGSTGVQCHPGTNLKFAPTLSSPRQRAGELSPVRRPAFAVVRLPATTQRRMVPEPPAAAPAQIPAPTGLRGTSVRQVGLVGQLTWAPHRQHLRSDSSSMEPVIDGESDLKDGFRLHSATDRVDSSRASTGSSTSHGSIWPGRCRAPPRLPPASTSPSTPAPGKPSNASRVASTQPCPVG